MTTTAITPALKVTMLKHLVAGRDLDFVTGVCRVPRDAVLDIVSQHGYPDHDKMSWAIDILSKGEPIPVRSGPVIGKPQVLLTDIKPTPQDTGIVHHTPPVAVLTATSADILRQAAESSQQRTRNLGTKISALLDDLTARLSDEQAAVEAKARAAHEDALVASRIVTLQAEIDKLKGKRRKPAKVVTTTAAASRSYTQKRGEFPCDSTTCDRVFTTIQGAVTHRRRAHEGFNPTKAAS